MKSPTGELLHLRAEANAEPQRSGFTGALELYDELINFLGLSPEKPQPAVSHPETTSATSSPEPVAPPPSAPTTNSDAETASQASPPTANQLLASDDPHTTKAAANSGALSYSEDVIRITGALAGFVASKAAGSTMVVCGDCGNPSDSGEMFCIHCGGLLDEPAASVEILSVAGLCDDCGAMVESDEIFCPSCGSVMANA
jgi:hypothetical protein